MANLGAKFYFQSEKSDCRWICSRAVQFDLSEVESLISKAGVFHCISLWVPENHYSWLEILFLCFKFSFSPLFLSFSSPPSQFLKLSSQMLGITGLLETQKIFKWFSCFLEQFTFGWSLLVGILGFPPSFLFAVMKTRFGALGGGRGAEESKAGK